MYAEEEEEETMNANRKLSVYKHLKKKAANDAQLLMYVGCTLVSKLN